MNLKGVLIIALIAFFINSCGSDESIKDKEVELLKKENELLKKERQLENLKDNLIAKNSKGTTTSKTPLTKSDAKKKDVAPIQQRNDKTSSPDAEEVAKYNQIITGLRSKWKKDIAIVIEKHPNENRMASVTITNKLPGTIGVLNIKVSWENRITQKQFYEIVVLRNMRSGDTRFANISLNDNYNMYYFRKSPTLITIPEIGFSDGVDD